MYKKYFKRMIDFTAALFGIILLSPFFVIIIIVLSIVNKGKPFFFQQRPGKNGQLFTLVKFRTMNEKKDEQGQLLPDMQRLTKTGAFLRKYSLDELSNLWNVLIGDMSLIGPRPLLKEYLPLYSEKQAKRHDICSGVTGWAQINGRNAISWQQKFELDVWYVENLSFSLDMKIFFQTMKKIFQTHNVNASEELTMEWFNGGN
ncbi:MAG: sugar transferase [Candidatus Symbiothrix sp.]|jgi:lipopolysaccharide/colanic/teichoic acid biosynthesis glycosyltransferase|nr:sugar transferase [Candidatus Symbiothrix sp.]